MIKIALDAGHGLYTNGKRCLKSLDYTETREWVLNSRIADKVMERLKNYDIEVLRVDDVTGKKDVPLYFQNPLNSREQKANDWGADIYISIHHNAGAEGSESGGTVCYYTGVHPERKEQCQLLYNSIVKYTKLVGNRVTKIFDKAYSVIKYTNMPAFLIENGFMDSKTDVPIILSEEHADNTAMGIVEFILKYFKVNFRQALGQTDADEEWVKDLQRELNKAGYRDLRKRKLVEDGIIGKYTKSAINKVILKKGDTNGLIRVIQQKLKDDGYKSPVNGIFDHATYLAVKCLQKKHNLEQDGIIGEYTLNALIF